MQDPVNGVGLHAEGPSGGCGAGGNSGFREHEVGRGCFGERVRLRGDIVFDSPSDGSCGVVHGGVGSE